MADDPVNLLTALHRSIERARKHSLDADLGLVTPAETPEAPQPPMTEAERTTYWWRRATAAEQRLDRIARLHVETEDGYGVMVCAPLACDLPCETGRIARGED